MNADLLSDPINVTVNAYIRSKDVKVSMVKVSLEVFDDDDEQVYIENITLFEIPQNSVELAEFLWVVPDNRTGEYTFKVTVNPERTINETTHADNNAIETVEIGHHEEEPFNWRPIYVAIAITVILIVFYLFLRWRRPY